MVTTSPAFTTPREADPVSVSTANPSRDGTSGTFTTVATGAADGSIVSMVGFKATGDAIRDILRIWVYDSTANFLIHEIVVEPSDPEATEPTFAALWRAPGRGVVLASGHELRVSTHNGNEYHVWAAVDDL